MRHYERRWAARHPHRWVAHWWLHIVVVASLLALAWSWSHPVFERVFGFPAWPPIAVFVAGLVAATAVAPFADRLGAVTGAAMVTLGVLRLAALAEVVVVEEAGSSTQMIAVSLAAHALTLTVLGLVWPTWTELVGVGATVEAGQDDREAGSA